MSGGTLAPLLDSLFETLEDLRAGAVEPKVATAVATVAASIVRTYEVSELEVRLSRLEGDR
jgi:hypothetical protein